MCISSYNVSVAEIKAETVVRNRFPQTFSRLKEPLKALKFDTLGEALRYSMGPVQTALLSKVAILQPHMKEELQGLTATPLKVTSEDLREFLQEAICPGGAEDAGGELLSALSDIVDQDVAGIPLEFEEIHTEPQSTTSSLNGALKISCGAKEARMEARVCPLTEFDRIAMFLQKDKRQETKGHEEKVVRKFDYSL